MTKEQAGIKNAQKELLKEYLGKITNITNAVSYTGRQAKDVFDIYMFSKTVIPLHIFLKGLSGQIQRGMIDWYQTFSRHELKMGLLDMDIYDKKFDARKMIIYLEDEIKEFIKEAVGQ